MNYTIMAIFIGILGLLIYSSIYEMKSNISRMNIMINKLALKAGILDDLKDELTKLISDGRKVEAIKRYRIATGIGLIEAKKYIDSLSDE